MAKVQHDLSYKVINQQCRRKWHTHCATARLVEDLQITLEEAAATAPGVHCEDVQCNLLAMPETMSMALVCQVIDDQLCTTQGGNREPVYALCE